MLPKITIDPLTLLFILLLAGCRTATGPSNGDEQVVLHVWFHSGRQAERETIQGQIDRFNASQDSIVVSANTIPENTYNGQVQAAALADDLPDVLELDGPYLYNYAWQGHLRAVGDALGEQITSDLLPSVVEQGTYRGDLYAVGTYDAGLGLYGRRSRLESVGARVPTSLQNPWTVNEFRQVLEQLASDDSDGAVLDLKLNYRGEWYTFAFLPVLRSAGGGLICRPDYQSAGGVLDGSASIGALNHVQSWIEGGYVDPNIDDAAFTQGRVALSWSGHWDYGRYADAAGDDLVVMPLPDFGEGPKTSQGSWCWAMAANCAHPEEAAKFLRFLLQTDEVLAIAAANSAVPARESAIDQSRLYREGGNLRLYALQLKQGYAVPRPRTPAYPAITQVFQRAFHDIRNGADVSGTLKRAAASIDQDIRDNRGYPKQN